MDRLRALGRRKLIAIGAGAVLVTTIACGGLASSIGNGAEGVMPTPETTAEQFATVPVTDTPLPPAETPTSTATPSPTHTPYPTYTRVPTSAPGSWLPRGN